MDVIHNGHSGDIIYSLPLVKHFCKKATFWIANDVPSDMPDGMIHPNGKIMMPESAVEFLRPLLESQDYIESVKHAPLSEMPAGMRLDFFRDWKMNTKAGNSADWLRKFYGIQTYSNMPWLSVEKANLDNPVICCFSRRYRNSEIDYSILKDIPNMWFVGLLEEYDFFKNRHGLDNLNFYKVKDALEMAQVIASAKFYFGNQTFGFSIAEALKIPRALEAFEPASVVVPSAPTGMDYMTNLALLNILLTQGFVKDQNLKNPVGATFHLYLGDEHG